MNPFETVLNTTRLAVSCLLYQPARNFWPRAPISFVYSDSLSSITLAAMLVGIIQIIAMIVDAFIWHLAEVSKMIDENDQVECDDMHPRELINMLIYVISIEYTFCFCCIICLFEMPA